MRKLLLLTLLVIPLAAHAAPRGDTALFIGEEVCKWADENAPKVPPAAYQPGVDVNGQPVAPAEVKPLSMAEQHQQEIAERMLRQMTIEITSDLAVQLGIPDKLIRQRLTVGAIELDDKGEPTVNGEPLVDPDPLAWQEACKQSAEQGE